jgi:uncharacterized protein (DUF3084 family)
MLSKDDISSAIYDAKYGSLSAFAQERVDRIYRQSNGHLIENQAPQFQRVDVNEKTAKQLQAELDALRDENAELWEENEQLKVANMELERRNSRYANRDSWLAGQQQDGFSDSADPQDESQ